MKRALAYAEEHGLGLMEASDVVVPANDECISDDDNLHAAFFDEED